MGLGGWRKGVLAAALAAGVLAGPAAPVLAHSGSTPVVSLSASPNPALSDYTNVYISGQGTHGGGCGIQTYRFSFGDGSSTLSTYAYAYHYYHVPSNRTSETFTVTLTVYDNCGGSSSATFAEVVDQDQPPVANLVITHSSSDASAIYADASGSTDNDQTTPYEFDFYWGDLTETTVYAPTAFAYHIYRSAGTHNVLVNVFDYAYQQGHKTHWTTVPITVQPSAPSNVVATAGHTQATVSWSAPTAGGTPSSYTVTASPGGATKTVGGTASQATVTGLSDGTTYTFTVTATTGGGSTASQPSNPVTPPLGTPLSPTSVTATADNLGAAVSWSAPASDGVADPRHHRTLPDHYTVTASPADTPPVTVSGSPPPTNTTIYGLRNSTSYTFTVTATNSTGTSLSSAPSNRVSPKPMGPTITDQPHWKLVRPSTVGTSSTNLPLTVTVLWTGQPGTSGICLYTLQRSLNNGPWTNIALTSPTATTASDTIPASLDLVRYQVQATDCSAKGVTSSWVQGAEFGYAFTEENSHKFLPFGPDWSRPACSSCAGGFDETTNVSGATATLTLNAAYNIGLVFAVGPTLGSADIYLDGNLVVPPVDTYAPTSGYRQLLYKTGWGVFGFHTIQVKNLATPGHPGIALDGSVVLYAPLAMLGK